MRKLHCALLLLALIAPPASLAAEQFAKTFYVVLASFATQTLAQEATPELAKQVEVPTLVVPGVAGESDRYRVAVGPYESYRAAADALASASVKGIAEPWILAVEPDLSVDLPEVAPAPEPALPAAAPSVARATTAPSELLQREMLAKRGVPSDLSRSVRIEITEQSAQRYIDTRQDVAGKLLPDPPVVAGEQLARVAEVDVREIRVTGGQMLAAQVAAQVAPFRGRVVSVEELLSLKNSINRQFVEQGYINSGVVIPDQKIEDGIINMQLIEGEVSQINVDARLRDSFIRKRIATGKPFNLQELQASLKLLEKHRLVERIRARVEPGGETGLATLALSVDTTPFYIVGMRAANNGSPSVGSEYGELYIQTDDLTTFGDTLRLARSVTRGLDSYNVNFSIPFNRRDHSFFIGQSVTNSTVIEEPFDAVDIESETKSVRAGFDLPLYRTTRTTLSLEISVEKRRNQTKLLGQRFSFSEGAVDGESRVSPVRVSLAYLNQGLAQSLAARMVISRGTDRWDATENIVGADGQFTAYLAQFQYSRQLTDRIHATTRMLVQRTTAPLLSIERLAVGGMETVRGYRENQLVRDEVDLIRVEARYRLPFEASRTEFVTFFDWGSGANHDDSISPGKETISSAGVGISYRSPKGLSGELYWAHPFDDINQQTEDLQDKGIHFSVNYEYRF